MSLPGEHLFPSHNLEDDAFAPEILALIPEYVQGRRAELRRLERALATHDFETIESIGHNFKGTGSSFGFPELTDAGAEMESAAREKNRESILQSAQRIEKAISNR